MRDAAATDHRRGSGRRICSSARGPTMRQRSSAAWIAPSRSLLKGDPMPWLLERSDPAVRAQTLRSLLDKGPRDPDLREAQQRAMSTPPISTILRRQKPDASWPGENLYGPKYEGTHWANL